MKEESIVTLQYKLLLAKYKAGDKNAAHQVMDMILGGDIKAVARPLNREMLFLPASRFEGKCRCCGEPYEKGAPVFVKDKKGWHLKCASNEDLENTYLKTCLKKGLVEDTDLPPQVTQLVTQDIERVAQ